MCFLVNLSKGFRTTSRKDGYEQGHLMEFFKVFSAKCLTKRTLRTKYFVIEVLVEY